MLSQPIYCLVEVMLAGRTDLILERESKLSKWFTLYNTKIENIVCIAMGLHAASV